MNVQVYTVPQVFQYEQNIKLNLDLELEEITEGTRFSDEDGIEWTLFDLRIDNISPFHLTCSNYDGPVWLYEDDIQVLPLNGRELSSYMIEQQFQIEDYLFEPNIDKIREVSDFDVDKGFIPRIDVFGDFIGDDILDKRQQLTKAVFHGFYEDLTEDSEVQLFDEVSNRSFRNSQNSLLRDLDGPKHILCYNYDILIDDNDRYIKGSDSWISSNLNMSNYTPEMKFIVHCFELLRLTHLDRELAELLKFLTYHYYAKLNITEANYLETALALFNYVMEFVRASNRLEYYDTNLDLNYIEIPLFYSFSKKSIVERLQYMSKIIDTEEIEEFIEFKLEIKGLIVNEEGFQTYELRSNLDSTVGRKLLDVYYSYLEKLDESSFRVLLVGEVIMRFYLVFPEEVIGTMLPYFNKISDEFQPSLRTLEDVRLIGLEGSEFLYKNFTWGLSYLYNILTSQTLYYGDKLIPMDYLIKTYLITQTRRDYIQFLFTYSEVLQRNYSFKLRNSILTSANQYLFSDEIGLDTISTYSRLEHHLQTYYVIPSKLLMRMDIKEDLVKLINRMYFALLAKKESIKPLSNEILNNGLEIIEEFLENKETEKISLILNSRSVEIFDIFYRIELYSEAPKISKLLQISEYYLKLTENQNLLSYLYPINYNHTPTRIAHILNLCVLYHISGDLERVEDLKMDFEKEFSNKIDPIFFSKIKDSMLSEELLVEIITNNSLGTTRIDRSMIYYLKIRKSISNYFVHKSRKHLLDNLLEILHNTNQFENYRPKIEGLKLVYRIMLGENASEQDRSEIKEKLMTLIRTFDLSEDELIEDYISDNELKVFSSFEYIPKMLAPIN